VTSSYAKRRAARAAGHGNRLRHDHRPRPSTPPRPAWRPQDSGVASALVNNHAAGRRLRRHRPRSARSRSPAATSYLAVHHSGRLAAANPRPTPRLHAGLHDLSRPVSGSARSSPVVLLPSRRRLGELRAAASAPTAASGRQRLTPPPCASLTAGIKETRMARPEIASASGVASRP